MSRFTMLAVAACLISPPAGFAADAPDPIQARLDKAKKKYDADMEAYRKSILDALDKKEDEARDKGAKKTVDLIKAQRGAFTKDNTFPALVPATLKQKAVSAAKELEAAYATAIKEFTKTSQDEEATVAEKEWEKLKVTAGILKPAPVPAPAKEADKLTAAEMKKLAADLKPLRDELRDRAAGQRNNGRSHIKRYNDLSARIEALVPKLENGRAKMSEIAEFKEAVESSAIRIAPTVPGQKEGLDEGLKVLAKYLDK